MRNEYEEGNGVYISGAPGLATHYLQELESVQLIFLVTFLH